MKTRNFVGLGILLVVVLTVGLVMRLTQSDPSSASITVSGVVGGKTEFLDDPDVKALLKERYGLTVDYRKVGSIEQVTGSTDGLDFLWPSSQYAVSLYRQRVAPSPIKSQVVFNSPIVMYTWAPIADALIAQGIVQKQGETYELVDLNKLLQMILDGRQWSEIGVQGQYGAVTFLTSDPNASNSGAIFSGLLANTLNGGQVVDGTTVKPVLPQLLDLYREMGMLQQCSSCLFAQFLTLGQGAEPIIAGYETQLLEYSIAYPSQRAAISEKVRTLHLRPTIWSTDEVIALTPNGEKLLTALRDRDMQSLGWEHHGFRAGVPGIVNDPAIMKLPGVPETIDAVIQLPEPAVMDMIRDTLDTLKGTPTAATIVENAPPIAVISERRRRTGIGIAL